MSKPVFSTQDIALLKEMIIFLVQTQDDITVPKEKKKELESSIEFIKDAKHAEEKRRVRVRKYDGGASGTETESSHRNVRATTASAGVRLRGVRAETGAGGSGSANRAFKFRLAFPAVQNN